MNENQRKMIAAATAARHALYEAMSQLDKAMAAARAEDQMTTRAQFDAAHNSIYGINVEINHALKDCLAVVAK